MASFCERLNALESKSDLDEQTLNVDCEAGTLGISGGNSVDLADLGSTTRQVWTVGGADRGFTFESWTEGNASGVANPDSDEDGFNTAWSGAPVDGIPTHVNGAPNFTGVETDVRFAQSESGQDEHRVTYWIHNDRAVPIQLQDIDTRAESAVTYAGCDCPSFIVEERYQSGGGTPYHSQGTPFLTVPPGGLIKVTVLIHDAGPDFSGFWLRANEVGDTTLFDPVSYQARPVAEFRDETWLNCDTPYVLAAGESFKPIDLDCLDCGDGDSGGLEAADVQALIDASATPHVEPATSLPIADNELDTAIRTGQIGTSLEYARADHNHPIVRQANPGDPVFIVGGDAVITQDTIILDRWSTEEEYTFNTRTRVSIPAGTGWGWVTVPTIAGFQQPQIIGLGSYRSDSTVPQADDGAQGAAPRGPYMGREVHHWSSTNRLYIAYFRRDNAITSLFIEAVVRYIRT